MTRLVLFLQAFISFLVSSTIHASASAFVTGKTAPLNAYDPLSFTTERLSTRTSLVSQGIPSPTTKTNLSLLRGGGKEGAQEARSTSDSPTAIMAATTGTSAAAADPAAKNKKVRIQAFDSMRFFLILNIVLGHFIMFAQPSPTVLKFFSQHNVLVGAFFALSGYVTVRFLIFQQTKVYPFSLMYFPLL